MKKLLILALVATAILFSVNSISSQNEYRIPEQSPVLADSIIIPKKNDLVPLTVKTSVTKENPEIDFWNFVNDSIKTIPKDSVNWKIVHLHPENGIKMSIVLTKPGKKPTSEPVRYWAYFQSDKKVLANQKEPVKIFKANYLVFSFSKIGTYKPVPLVTNNVVQRNVYVPENVTAVKIELNF